MPNTTTPDDRLTVKTPLYGGGPIIVIDPDRHVPVFVSNDGSALGVESLALNPGYSFAKHVLVPEERVANWLGFPTPFYLYQLVPDDVRMAPRHIPNGKDKPIPCWTFEYAIHLIYTAKIEPAVRTSALKEAYQYLSMAALQVCRTAFRSVHTEAQLQLAKARERIDQMEKAAASPKDKSRLPSAHILAFPEGSSDGWVEYEYVRVAYTYIGHLYVRFPRETCFRDVPKARAHMAATISRQNHGTYPTVVPTEVTYPISYIDGDSDGDTIIVCFKLLNDDRERLEAEDERNPEGDAFALFCDKFARRVHAHVEHMKMVRSE